MKMKRTVCAVLVAILLLGAISAGLMTYAPDGTAGTPSGNDKRQVSDYFYIQVYNSEDQAVSKYVVMLTGMVSGTSQEITSVSFGHESGDECRLEYSIDGDTAYIMITHPTEGYLARVFKLSASGEFVGY